VFVAAHGVQLPEVRNNEHMICTARHLLNYDAQAQHCWIFREWLLDSANLPFSVVAPYVGFFTCLIEKRVLVDDKGLGRILK
jgi:hypothetical protein